MHCLSDEKGLRHPAGAREGRGSQLPRQAAAEEARRRGTGTAVVIRDAHNEVRVEWAVPTIPHAVGTAHPTATEKRNMAGAAAGGTTLGEKAGLKMGQAT